MKKFIYLCVILAGCMPEPDCRQNHIHMQFSEAQPVRYYRNGEETYNEKAICGVEKRCWSNPWNCSDRISSQFVHDEEGEYFLQIIDRTLNEVTRIPFTPTGLSSMGLPNFTDWTDDPLSAGTVAWTTGFNPSVAITGIAASHDLVSPPIVNVPAGEYLFKYRFTTNSVNGHFEVEFYKDGNLLFEDAATLPTNGNNTGSIAVTLAEAPDECRIYALNGDEFGSTTITANRFSLDLPATDWSYDIGFVPQNLSPAICNQDVAFKVISENILQNPKFTLDSKWYNEGVGGSWLISGNVASVTFLGSGQSSKDFIQDLVDGQGDPASYSGDIEIEAVIEQDATTNNVFFVIEVAGTNHSYSTLGVPGIHNISHSASGVTSFNQVKFRASSPTNGAKTIRVLSIKVTVDGVTVWFYKTDAQSIKTSHPCSQLIEYWDSEDFEGLSYGGSPQKTFQKRMFADFWQDEEAITQELHMLSDGELVQLRAEMEKKREFRMDWAPQHEARLFGYIMMHQYVYIDSKYWKMKDSIERTKAKRLSLVTFAVLLTESDIDRNVF